MAWEARVVAEGLPRHFTPRVDERQDGLLQEADRGLYLATGRTKAGDHTLTVLGY